ncbi:MAG: F0F1 ATP synthase subunit delta [Pseudomonadota bacterium]
MAEKSTIARPYAKAVFELAKAEGKFGGWSDMLRALAAVAGDPAAQKVFRSPSVSKEQVVSLIADVLGNTLSADGLNLVKLLAENKRLALLPEIAAMFEQLRAEAEKTIDAEVISAFEVSAAEQQKIKAALKNRMGREVNLSVRIDPSLIGGAIIKAGDLSIDGSVAGKLQRLATTLSR